MSDVDLIVVYATDKRLLDRLEELYRLVADAGVHGRVIIEAA